MTAARSAIETEVAAPGRRVLTWSTRRCGAESSRERLAIGSRVVDRRPDYLFDALDLVNAGMHGDSTGWVVLMLALVVEIDLPSALLDRLQIVVRRDALMKRQEIGVPGDGQAQCLVFLNGLDFRERRRANDERTLEPCTSFPDLIDRQRMIEHEDVGTGRLVGGEAADCFLEPPPSSVSFASVLAMYTKSGSLSRFAITAHRTRATASSSGASFTPDEPAPRLTAPAWSSIRMPRHPLESALEPSGVWRESSRNRCRRRR